MQTENFTSASPFASSPEGTKNALIVVAKEPKAGYTKTRLAPPLTLEQAAQIYEVFLADTLDLMRQIPNVQLVIAFLPEEGQEYFRLLAPDFRLIPQTGSNLGARLDHALTYFLESGYRSAVIMDSDSPTLPLDYLTSAFKELRDGSDVVLGPCSDGGYYLIGLKKPAPRLFHEIKMSTPSVTYDTLALAQEEGLKVSLLTQWYDVDDRRAFARLLAELENTTGSVAPHTRAFLERFPGLGKVGEPFIK